MKAPHATQGDASPQRWLEEGEVLRTTRWNRDTRRFVVTETYLVPKTLRLLGNENVERPFRREMD